MFWCFFVQRKPATRSLIHDATNVNSIALAAEVCDRDCSLHSLSATAHIYYIASCYVMWYYYIYLVIL